jgi:GNAT superfamily N-acetyltransferase
MDRETARCVTVRHDVRPGDLGRVIALHGVLYAQEYGFGIEFEVYAAETMAEFGKLARPGLDRLWLAERDGQLVGSIAILGRGGRGGRGAAGQEAGEGPAGEHEIGSHENGAAQLRCFLVHPGIRGTGLGRQLLAEALAFCRAAGYRTVYLWTFNGLDAAIHLYRSHGFRKTETKPPADLWGVELSEERYDLVL